MFITIRKNRDGSWLIEDSNGNHMRYYGYSKRSALKEFKKTFGLRHKHNIDLIDYTVQKRIENAFAIGYASGVAK